MGGGGEVHNNGSYLVRIKTGGSRGGGCRAWWDQGGRREPCGRGLFCILTKDKPTCNKMAQKCTQARIRGQLNKTGGYLNADVLDVTSSFSFTRSYHGGRLGKGDGGPLPLH